MKSIFGETTSPNEIIDIEDIKRLYTEATVRTKKYGFDIIQLHLALWVATLCRFLNPMYKI